MKRSIKYLLSSYFFGRSSWDRQSASEGGREGGGVKRNVEERDLYARKGWPGRNCDGFI
jgi:hypothetical protein